MGDGLSHQADQPEGLRSTGRFTTTDPLRASTSDPYVATYVYANDRPIVMADPSGMRGQEADFLEVDFSDVELLSSTTDPFEAAKRKGPWHLATQLDLSLRFAPPARINFGIKGAGRKKDAYGFADVYRQINGEVWEVKPLSAYGLRTGTPQVTRYYDALRKNGQLAQWGRFFQPKVIEGTDNTPLITISGAGKSKGTRAGNAVRYYVALDELKDGSKQKLLRENTDSNEKRIIRDQVHKYESLQLGEWSQHPDYRSAALKVAYQVGEGFALGLLGGGAGAAAAGGMTADEALEYVLAEAA